MAKEKTRTAHRGRDHGVDRVAAGDRTHERIPGKASLIDPSVATTPQESLRNALSDARVQLAALEAALRKGDNPAEAVARAGLETALTYASRAAELLPTEACDEARHQIAEIAAGDVHVTDDPTRAPSVVTRMTRDVDVIVERLQGMWLGAADQQAIVDRIEPYVHIDDQLRDLHGGANYYLDRFLVLLKGRAYRRSAPGTLFQTQHAIVFDDLWRRLQGDSLARFRAIVMVSRTHRAGPGTATYDDALASVVAPVFWRAAALLSLGIVTPDLFDAMAKAVAAGSRPGSSMFMEQFGVVLRHGGAAAFDFLTLGTVRATYEGAVAYATKHPDCTMREIRLAGLLAAADAVLPRQELLVIAKAFGWVDLDKGELPPETGKAWEALFQAMLKIVVLGAIVKAKIDQGRPRAEIRERLTGQRARAPRAPRAPARQMPTWRQEILRRVRKVTGNPNIVFWEQVPLGSVVEGLRAGPEAAHALGVPRGSILGYVVDENAAVKGGAIGDLGAVETTAPPYPDPFTTPPHPTWQVDPAMRAADAQAGLIVNEGYITNPTARVLTSLVDASGKIGGKKMSGKFMYVVDAGGTIIIGSRGGQRMPHPTLVGGPDPTVRAAGIVDIRGGRIYSIDNSSGHFKPGSTSLDAARAAFGVLPEQAFHREFRGYVEHQ